MARKVGLDYTVNPTKTDLSEAVLNAFGSDKADLILECVGVQPTMEAAIINARKGTDIIVVGVFGDKPLVDLGLVQDHEIRLIGTAMYQTRDYLQAIDLIQKGAIQLKPLMTDHFAFEDYEKAYTYLDEKKDKAMKVFIDLD
jgi:L-iditol 2-dehydrogenase